MYIFQPAEWLLGKWLWTIALGKNTMGREVSEEVPMIEGYPIVSAMYIPYCHDSEDY